MCGKTIGAVRYIKKRDFFTQKTINLNYSQKSEAGRHIRCMYMPLLCNKPSCRDCACTNLYMTANVHRAARRDELLAYLAGISLPGAISRHAEIVLACQVGASLSDAIDFC